MTPFILSIISTPLDFRIRTFRVCISHHVEVLWIWRDKHKLKLTFNVVSMMICETVKLHWAIHPFLNCNHIIYTIYKYKN